MGINIIKSGNIRRHLLKCLITLNLVTWGCGSISTNYPDGDFHILIVSDTHVSNDDSKIERLNCLTDKINRGDYPGLAFVVNTGDVVSSIYKSYNPENADHKQSRLFNALVAFNRLEVPYYWVMGNHDYKIDSDRDSDAPYEKDEILFMEKIWKQMTGFDAYYSFEYGGWKFVVSNSMHGRYKHRSFDEDQLDWFASELEAEVPIVLFFHHPLQTDNFRIWSGAGASILPEVEQRFYSILEKNVNQIKGIFVGHGHLFVQDHLFDKIKVYETASFADDKDMPHLVVGIDTTSQSINVGKKTITPINKIYKESMCPDLIGSYGGQDFCSHNFESPPP